MVEVSGTFKVIAKDIGGKIFEGVSRFKLEGEDLTVFVDINTDLFPLEEHDRIKLDLTKTLNRDGSPMDIHQGYSDNFGKNTKMDDFDYVMSGMVFKFVENKNDDNLSVIASFGGLLLMLYGKPEKLSAYNMKDQVYLLIRKTN
ncbi:RNA polymerase subunit Rpb8, putative [Entamoeba histolytica HM-1:IMSS-B]|uniref:DNA-directed RNA polymerases I, II, and III subunit RPABC3 n=8 Tax=Entamoeba TaxID=5758 RepID=C4LZP1_ENTH1|nr:RNA polymerase subunit Rpb8, putative [Entamoeba nuttalli P19]XP_656855.1 RNA polymerase subunit Rpb8 [Entamoeba histolytica HM-1:IMSS]EMD48952.1 RNA polymerase subunit Rpb8, putative [Entamoeba histolytica KU27]EMH72090.1 RNA polymerase subunit Rpb8, putative [Entamoeba histolytica HM-1:IMSS-B]EMS16279.1 RNA polymerase subunit Rpb8, putative [Entamoeba histolytica HM-3:IMSS]ENY61434.1 RNA polymerase subunit Rpb8, putative [Entamoeba histolytica HM-1:IMSS-A]GAT94344.1 RNA polymerase subuni|eukprot:XP_008859177.1 RNA polymerase subunit Rpb8, putative [Entamoeba nuttalli P19]